MANEQHEARESEAVTDAIIAQHDDDWRSATEHPFLQAVREGTLAEGAFERWLVQDYLYVCDLLAFQGRLLGRAPRAAQSVLASGLVGLEAELTWFEEQADRRGLRLQVERNATTESYRIFLARLDVADYATVMTSLWTLERVYLEAWMFARPGDATYREFVDHWTVPEFAAYVKGLEHAANDAIASEGGPSVDTERAFRETLELERRFWDMAWVGSGQ
jgi:formylaminopyrimidine deformylase / aminopyrimidine aminohydrolase